MNLFTISMADGECGHTIHLVKHRLMPVDLLRLTYSYLPIEKIYVKKFGKFYVEFYVKHSSQTEEKWEKDYRVIRTKQRENITRYRIRPFDEFLDRWLMGHYLTVIDKGKISRKEQKTLQKFELLHEISD